MNSTSEGLSALYPATAASVPRVREEIARFAQTVGVPDEVVERIRLAATEAVTNAVRHAYPGGGGDVELTARAVEDELWIFVSDHGCGHQVPSRTPGLGYGLAIIADACSQFTIAERSQGGTEVRMYFDLRACAGRA